NQPPDISIARRQTRSNIELFESALVVLIHPVDALTQGKMGFCQVGLETKGYLRFGASSAFPILGRLVIMENLSANRCKPRMGKRKVRVERDRLHVKLLCSLVILQQRVRISGDLIRPQIKHIGIRVLRWLGCYSRLLIRTERSAQSVGDFTGQLPLQPQRISQRTVVTLRPDLPGALRIDQLHVDDYPVTFPPHTALKDIRDAKQLTDPAQVLRSGIAKLHYRRPADDPEVFDLCQAGKNIVLNAVREKCIVFVRAKVFEW